METVNPSFSLRIIEKRGKSGFYINIYFFPGGSTTVVNTPAQYKTLQTVTQQAQKNSTLSM